MFKALALTLFLASQPYVYDGDTIYYGKSGMRLHGIDAPELAEKFGPEARDALKSFLEGKDIQCIATESDKYHRFIVRCMVDDQDVSAWMVKNGWAYAYRKYSTDYVDLEKHARQHKLGMFQRAITKRFTGK